MYDNELQSSGLNGLQRVLAEPRVLWTLEAELLSFFSFCLTEAPLGVLSNKPSRMSQILDETPPAASPQASKKSQIILSTMTTEGKPITCKAMVARGPKVPLVAETITVYPPKEGEVRVKVVA